MKNVLMFLKIYAKIYAYMEEDMKENKHEKFIRLAEARTNRILEHLRLLSNLSNKSNYDYTDDEIKKIISAIEKELKLVKNAFTGVESIEQKFRLNV